MIAFDEVALRPEQWNEHTLALAIKDPETERLAAEVAGLTGETKAEAVREALRRRKRELERQRPRTPRG